MLYCMRNGRLMMKAPPSSDTQKAKRAGVGHSAQRKGRGECELKNLL